MEKIYCNKCKKQTDQNFKEHIFDDVVDNVLVGAEDDYQPKEVEKKVQVGNYFTCTICNEVNYELF
jgi:hypothetical protein